MLNTLSEIRATFVGVAIGLVTLLAFAVVEGPDPTVSLYTPVAPRHSVSEAAMTCITEEATPASINDSAITGMGSLRQLSKILATGLTDQERRWLSDQRAPYVTSELENNSAMIDPVIEAVLQEPNNATRRYLVTSLTVLNGAQLEETIQRLLISDRKLDQEAAINLALASNNTEQRAYLIEKLLSLVLDESLMTNVVYRIRESIDISQAQAIRWQLQELYRKSNNKSASLMILDAITPKKTMADVEFFEILDLIENNTTKTETEKLLSMKYWIESHVKILSNTQKETIKTLTESKFSATTNFERKKISLTINRIIENK